MDLLTQTWAYAAENAGRVQQAMLVHLLLSFGALGIAMLLFIPLGVLVSTGGKLTSAIVGAVAAVRVIPSLAVIFLLLPIFGLGWRPALIALTVLA
jgi:osmoprotectant transport system permease protein